MYCAARDGACWHMGFVCFALCTPTASAPLFTRRQAGNLTMSSPCNAADAEPVANGNTAISTKSEEKDDKAGMFAMFVR